MAAAAAKLGLEAHLIHRSGSTNWREPETHEFQSLGNVQITTLLKSTKTQLTSATEVMEQLSSAGKKPYNIPTSAMHHLLGGIGFASFAFELIYQEKTLIITFDRIVVPAATGSTVDGMLAGFRLAAERFRDFPHATRARLITAVFVGSDIWTLEPRLLETAQTTARALRLEDTNFEASQEYELIFDYNAGAYGVADQRTVNAMRIAGTLEGITLDPAYTGKAFAYVIDMVTQSKLIPGSRILFVHTGGASVLSAYGHLDLS